MHTEELSAKFIPALTGTANFVFEEEFGKFLDERWEWFEKFHLSLSEWVDNPENLAATEEDIESYAASLLTFLEKCNEHISLPDFIPGHAFIRLAERFCKISDETGITGEHHYRLPLSRAFWKIQVGDPSGVRLKKSFSYFYFRVGNIFRKKSAQYYGTQSFQIKPFLEYLFLHPLLEIALRLEREWMLACALKIEEIHKGFEQLMLRLTGEEVLNLPKGRLNRDKISDIFQVREFLKNHLVAGKTKNEWLKSSLTTFKEHSEAFLLNLQHDILLSGTCLLPEKKFSASKTKEYQEKLFKILEVQTNQWQDFFRGEKSDWLKDTELLSLQIQVILIDFLTKKAIREKYRELLFSKTDKTIEILTGSIEHLKKLSNENEDDFEQHFLKENRSMIRDLRKKHIPGIIDAFDQVQVLKNIDNYRSRIRYRIDGLSDTYSIIESSGLDLLHPRIHVSRIELKDIIIAEFYQSLDNRFQQFRLSVDSEISALLRDLSEISLVIEVNLESALEALHGNDRESSRPDAHMVVIEGLTRSENLLKKIRLELLVLSEKVNEQLSGLSGQFLGNVRELADNDKIFNLRFRLAKADTFKHLRNLVSRGGEWFRTYVLPVFRWFGSNVLMIRSGYSHIRRLTGLESASEEKRKALQRFLYTSRKRIEKLPFVYQRLFRLEPLADERMFTGREEKLKVLGEITGNWRKGEFSCTAVTGEKGSGRTTLINILTLKHLRAYAAFRMEITRTYTDEKVFLDQLGEVFRMPGIHDPDEFETALNNLEKPVVCLVENLHNLYIRTVDGFSLLERFLLLMARTQKNVFWIITCGHYGWKYLDRVLKISRYFENVISLDDLNSEILREVILKRHRLSGFNLHFLPSPETLRNRKYKYLRNEKQRQNYLSNNYFNQLNDISGGNISIAFLLWQLSVKDFKKDKLFMNDRIDFDAGLLSFLPQDEVFTLGALLEHEILTEQQHARIFNQDDVSSMMILSSMVNRGLLVKTKNGYNIHFLLYKEVVRLLTDRNIIH